MAKEKATEEQPTDLETTEEAQSTEEAQETTQPSLEEIQGQLAAEKAERERYENLYKDGQRKESSLIEKERELGQRAEVLNSLPDTLDEFRLEMARMRDSQTTQYGAENPPQYAPQTGQFEADVRRGIEARKQQKQPEKEEREDRETLEARVEAKALIKAMGWDGTHAAVQKTLYLDDPKEALKILQKEAKLDKVTRDREVEERYQAKIKESGVTTPETAGPSGQGTRSYTPAQIQAMSYEEYASQKDDIDKAYRAGNIK